MKDESLENKPTREKLRGFWCVIIVQSLHTFSDKTAQFILILLGTTVVFAVKIPVGSEWHLDMLPAVGLMIFLPMILFAPLSGWASDRFSKRDVILTTSVAQTFMLAVVCWAVAIRSIPLALLGLFGSAVQAAFSSPAKNGINKELIDPKHLGFAVGIQQMTALLAVLSGQFFAGWLHQNCITSHSAGVETVWRVALSPLWILMMSSIIGTVVAWTIPGVPRHGQPEIKAKLVVGHLINLAELWRDVPLRRAALGIAFFWGFAAFILLWSLGPAMKVTGVGAGNLVIPPPSLIVATLGLALGFGFAAFLLRRRIELGWVPVAGIMMTLLAASLAFLPPGGRTFMLTLGLLGFAGAFFLTPLSAWIQDRYPAARRGKLQSTVNLQNCISIFVAVLAVWIIEFCAKDFGISGEISNRFEIGLFAVTCGLVSLSILRLLPGDFIRLVGGAIIRSIYRIKVVNPERIPAKGGALLLPNHVTFADGLFISAACPRPVRFVMDESFMAKRSIRFFVSIFDTVTIRRDQPREAIRITIDALKKGDLVCLFPEGQLTRTGALNELRRGFELIAKKADHPLIPMWCDGSWGSIFSFERGRFFRKWPYRFPHGMAVAFGTEIRSENGGLEMVRQGLLAASAAAVGKQFEDSEWGRKIPQSKSGFARVMKSSSEATRRRIWVNGHQIGQVSGLQRHRPFNVLNGDPILPELPGVMLTFPELFGAKCKRNEKVDGDFSGIWVGGDQLRREIAHTQLSSEIVFYDFGLSALKPIFRAGVLHCPCLAVDGMVVTMSLPHPHKPTVQSEEQKGHKLGTWGKLLPGWLLERSATAELKAFGPAAPADGLALPKGCYLDAEGFLSSGNHKSG